jgi:hypothetical protein
MATRKWIIGLLVGTLAIAFTTIGATLFAPQIASAAGNNFGGPGWFRGMLGNGLSSRDTQLAEALGITTAELQTAQETARTTAIQQAVDQGFITQAQADQIILWGRLGFGGRGDFMGRGAPGGMGQQMKAAIDPEALLADALEISVDELQAAQLKAELAGVQEALDAGLITQIQADQMTGRLQLRTYIDQEEMLAEALGMTVEEYRTAVSEGKTITTLLTEQNTDAVTVRQKMMTAYQAAMQQAVTDGVITQTQADQFLSRGMNFGGPGGGFGDRMRPGGRGGDNQRGGNPQGRGGMMPQGQGDFQFNNGPMMPDQEASQLF